MVAGLGEVDDGSGECRRAVDDGRFAAERTAGGCADEDIVETVGIEVAGGHCGAKQLLRGFGNDPRLAGRRNRAVRIEIDGRRGLACAAIDDVDFAAIEAGSDDHIIETVTVDIAKGDTVGGVAS